MPDPSPASLRRQLFLLSFTALFLELMVIRWVPSVVGLIAFYANLMLLSSFLGLGAGALMAGKERWKTFGWFPYFLILEIGALTLCHSVEFGSAASEIRMSEGRLTFFNNVILILIFAANALVFVPLGHRIGQIFNQLPRLTAYGWDLAGSLAGSVCFALFSLVHFSPIAGMSVVFAAYLALSSRARWLLDLCAFAAVLFLMTVMTERSAIWSPYHYITVRTLSHPDVIVTAPPTDLRTMKDPPAYSVSVNHFYYHYDIALSPERYSPAYPDRTTIAALASYFKFPYALGAGRERALVMGGGGGGDIQGALASGLQHVDAVEIDPVVVAISNRFNPEAPYLDPRVTAHVDDARAFLAKTNLRYDFVVFGLLDSHALFSNMNNLRLDGYVYTVESVRTAFGLLKDDGVMTLAFYIQKDWLLPKLYHLVATATGRTPALYMLNRTAIFCVPKDPAAKLPSSVFQLQRAILDDVTAPVDVPTDDWPFLYLKERGVPTDYIVAIASLLLLSVGVLVWLKGGTMGRSDAHFGLLGAGFLLLETKSIGDCSLYFGATWLVSAIVVSGVLLMVIAANSVAERLTRFSPWLYLPLFLTLAVLIFIPREVVLGFPFGGRLVWSILVVPLPLLFAGLVFSTTFRDAALPSTAFGANLIGAMVGGFAEYLTMAIGNHRLSMLVVVVYLLSLLTTLSASRRVPAA